MQLLHLPTPDLVYCLLRFALSGLAAIAAFVSLRFAWQAWNEGRPWRLAGGGGILLTAATVLSAFDAIDNVVLRPHDPITLASWLWFFLFDLLLPIWTLLLVAAWRERDRALNELSKLSVTDQLTGTLNRRGFLERAAVSAAQSRRSGASISLVMFDIDHFKSINDMYGHGAGDEVLRNVAAVLSHAMRPGDLLGRLGGEEFAVLLHDTAVIAAASIAERLRAGVRNSVKRAGGDAVTMSGGVAIVDGHLEPEAALTLALVTADRALYSAKREGRDRIILAPPSDAQSETRCIPEPAGHMA